jgi:UDP-N-acetylmuramyl pentapeptide phosphotransferase/UDP-N-acetylglucosamine-1-phosphate transferase/glycosyltransferase involved in cell wall biosynthesis
MKFLLACFAVSALLTATLILLARRFRWSVAPRPERWSQRAVAKFGGIPILLTLAGSALCLPLDRKLAAIVGVTVLMSGLGFLDDLFQFSAPPKLAVQVLLSAGAVAIGVSYPLTQNPYLNALCTVAWLVGITNAFNIIDNMDGLAAGVAVIALAKLIFLPGAGVGASSLMLAMAGALLGFLVFNFYPAQVFMGDTGSLGVGFFLGCSAVLLTDHLSSFFSILAIPALVLFLPVFDAALVSVTRRWNGRSVMVGAKDHTSHRLVLLGMSERQAVLLLYLISASAGGVAALWKSEWHNLGAGMVALYLVMATGLWLYLARIEMPGSWLSERSAGALTVPAFLSRIAARVQKIPSVNQLFPIEQQARKAKVVRIIARLNVGGPARQACYLHSRLLRSFETVLITGQLAEGEGDMSFLLPSSENLYRVDSMRRSINLWSDVRALLTIVSILRRERPDIVHTHTAKAGMLGRLAAVLAGVPIRVHTYHGHVFEGYFSPLTSRIVLALERLVGKMTTRVIAISESQAAELSERFRVIERKKIALIRTGFELLPFVECNRGLATREKLGIQPSEFLVLWAGRMAPIKNVELLAAVVRAAQRNPRLRFLVAGNGTDSEKFERLTSGCGNVIRTGWCWPMTDIVSACDAALLTSHNEGTPATLIEAMSAGKPFVATEVGGVKDLAVPPLRKSCVGRPAEAANGFLTPSDPETILACLERLAADPELARTMGQCGRRFALEMHSAERLQEEIENLYFDLAAESSSPRLRNLAWGSGRCPAEPEPNFKDQRGLPSSR